METKRAMDVGVSALALVVFAPVMAILAVLIRLRLGPPVLFRQIRPGRDGRPFVLYKFRTMADARGPDGELLPDEQRLTKFGRWLRAMSLDELPELINVLRGDMSLVGPRPLLMDYLPRYSPFQARRQEVRPGITGFAQIHGRNDIPWDDKLAMDVWYVDNQSLTLDLKILWRTIVAVARRSGISKTGHATSDYFQGPGKDRHGTPPA
ncbi:MAG: sugar transferase [Actinomycetota bacterium]|nr:sugar transferase [Actinomycetota bacterium]